MLIPDDSPLRHLPPNLSVKQVLYFDGIRYSAEMAAIAYNRLFRQLNDIGERLRESVTQPTTAEIAAAMLDAWSIVDSTNRFGDLVKFCPGLKDEPWKRQLEERTKVVDELRNDIQHVEKGIIGLASRVSPQGDHDGGHVWGYLRWAQMRGRQRTGTWYAMAPGAVFKEDHYWIAGPFKTPHLVPPGWYD